MDTGVNTAEEESSSGIAGMSGGEFDSKTPVCFGCRSSNLILLNLTIALLLHLGTVTEVTEMRPLSVHFDCARNRMCQGRM